MQNDLDGVIVFGGTNDFGHNPTADFGSFDDFTKETTLSFYASLHRLFTGLYNKYRSKPIIIMLPIHHGSKVDVPEYIFN